MKEYAIIIENKNEEIKASISKIIELEKENEKLKEVTQLYLKYQLDEYHLKTWSFYKNIFYIFKHSVYFEYFLNLIVS